MEKITFDQWKQIQMKVGKILQVERVTKTDKLYKLRVDIGDQKSIQIVTGLVPYYTPEELQDLTIVVLTNLEPRKFAGEVSEGMLLCAENEENNECVLLTVQKNVAPGTPIT